jgi:hypothetical protein
MAAVRQHVNDDRGECSVIGRFAPLLTASLNIN